MLYTSDNTKLPHLYDIYIEVRGRSVSYSVASDEVGSVGSLATIVGGVVDEPLLSQR